MSLVEDLCAADWADRLRAIARVAEEGHSDAATVLALVDCTGDPHKGVQRRAAEALAVVAAAGSGAAAALLEPRLVAAEPRQRWGAAYALSVLGVSVPACQPVLLDCLGWDDGDVRWAAAAILLRFFAPASLLEPLCSLLSTGSNTQRKMACYCLRDIGALPAPAEPALMAALENTDASVRLAAMAALSRVAGNRGIVAQRLAEVLRSDADAGVRRAAAAVLGTLGERSAAVIGTLHAAAASADPSLQRAARRSLQLLGWIPQA